MVRLTESGVKNIPKSLFFLKLNKFEFVINKAWYNYSIFSPANYKKKGKPWITEWQMFSLQENIFLLCLTTFKPASYIDLTLVLTFILTKSEFSQSS